MASRKEIIQLGEVLKQVDAPVEVRDFSTNTDSKAPIDERAQEDVFDAADRAIREAYPGEKSGYWGEHHRIPNFGILRGAIAREVQAAMQVRQVPDYEAKFQSDITKLVMRHIDRMNDICEQDTAENIIKSFTQKFEAIFDPYMAVKFPTMKRLGVNPANQIAASQKEQKE